MLFVSSSSWCVTEDQQQKREGSAVSQGQGESGMTECGPLSLSLSSTLLLTLLVRGWRRERERSVTLSFHSPLGLTHAPFILFVT